jgi:hypothetical protein
LTERLIDLVEHRLGSREGTGQLGSHSNGL